MTTIRFELPELDLNGDGKVSLDEMIRGARWIIWWVVLAANAGWWFLVSCAWIVYGWENWTNVLRTSVIVFFGSVSAGIAVAAYVGIRRALLPEWQREQAVQDIEFERERKQYEFDQVKGSDTEVPNRAWNEAALYKNARRFLALSYEKGSFVTRKEWGQRGFSEDSWNDINESMKKHGVRNGRSSELQHETFADAWGAWLDAMDKSSSWVRRGEEFVKV